VYPAVEPRNLSDPKDYVFPCEPLSEAKLEEIAREKAFWAKERNCCKRNV